jgi:hypothetical protein
MRKSNRLPTRFPEGAKYVLESRGGVVHRFVEFPDGRRITLRQRKAVSCVCPEVQDVSIVPAAGHAETKRSRRRSPALAPL